MGDAWRGECPRPNCRRRARSEYGFTPYGLGGYRYCETHGFVEFSPETETLETERARKEADARERQARRQREAERLRQQEERRRNRWWRRAWRWLSD